MAITGFNLKLNPVMAMLPQIFQIWDGSGTLMGWVFLEDTTLFLEMVALFWVKMGVLSGLNLRVPLKWGSKWGILLFAPKPYLLPLLPFYLRDFLYIG